MHGNPGSSYHVLENTLLIWKVQSCNSFTGSEWLAQPKHSCAVEGQRGFNSHNESGAASGNKDKAGDVGLC